MIKLKDMLFEYSEEESTKRLVQYWKDFKKALEQEFKRSSENFSKIKWKKSPFSGPPFQQQFNFEWGGKRFEFYITDEGSDRADKVSIESFVKGKGSYKWMKSGRNASPERVAQSIRVYFESGGKRK